MINIEEYKDECFDVVGAIYNVKKELGPGLNEKVYQEGLGIELKAISEKKKNACAFFKLS